MATVVAQPQTSRAGLISALVCFIIISILMSWLFFTKNSENLVLQGKLDDMKKKYADVITDQALSSGDYATIRDQAKTAGVSVFDLRSSQVSDLSSSIGGKPMDFSEARQRAEQAVKNSNDSLKTLSNEVGKPTAAGTSLIDTLDRWPALLKAAIDQTRDARDKLKQADARNEQLAKTNEQALAEKDKAIADAKAETARVNEEKNQLQQAHEKSLADMKNDTATSIQGLSQQLTQVQAVVAQKDQAIAGATKEITRLMTSLRRFKVKPATGEDVVRVPDGTIKTVAGSNCFINLGEGDQIAVGMTFEVYDPNKGIPALGDGTASSDNTPRRRSAPGAAAAGGPGVLGFKDDSKYQYDLPKGKGSIEVIAVGPGHTSQCRIVHTEPGDTISQGDIIANLVYDKNIKYNFVVYGDFDLSNSNASVHPNDAPVIRRLIEQWGGAVQPILDPAHPAESVTPETDFLVVGKEPVIPSFSAEELGQPENQLAMEKAKAKLDAYRKVIEEAYKYGIPVLNQNRFLYYTGYYDEARR